MKANKIKEQLVFIKNDEQYEKLKNNELFISAIKKLEKYHYNLKVLDKKEQMSILSSFRKINEIVRNYKLVKEKIAYGGSHCDLCGIEIIYEFYLQNIHTKKQIKVGSECIIKYPVRVKNYDTLEEIKRYILSRKQEMTVVYRWYLWEQTPEYKNLDLVQRYYSFLSSLWRNIDSYIIIIKEKGYTLEEMERILISHLISNNYETRKIFEKDFPKVVRVLNHWSSDKKRKEEAINRIIAKLKEDNISKTHKFNLFYPYKKDYKKISFEIYQNNISLSIKWENIEKETIKENLCFSYWDLIGKKIYNSLKTINWKIKNLEKDRDINKIPHIKKMARIILKNKETINKIMCLIYSHYLSLYNNLMEILPELEKEEIEREKKRQEKILQEISKEAKDRKCGVLKLDNVYIDKIKKEEIRYSKEYETYKAILIKKYFIEKNYSVSIWLPKSQIREYPEYNVVLVPYWLLKKNGISLELAREK